MQGLSNAQSGEFWLYMLGGLFVGGIALLIFGGFIDELTVRVFDKKRDRLVEIRRPLRGLFRPCEVVVLPLGEIDHIELRSAPNPTEAGTEEHLISAIVDQRGSKRTIVSEVAAGVRPLALSRRAGIARRFCQT